MAFANKWASFFEDIRRKNIYTFEKNTAIITLPFTEMSKKGQPKSSKMAYFRKCSTFSLFFGRRIVCLTREQSESQQYFVATVAVQ
jgi:hypothetical protein